MAKKERQKVERETREAQLYRRGQEEQLTGPLKAELPGARKEAAAQRTQIGGLYGDTAKTGGFQPGVAEDLRERYRGMGETSGMPGVQERLRGMGELGGFDPEQAGKIRSGYGEFAETGGLSPEARQTFLRRAEAPIPAIYKQLSQEAGRSAAITGGYQPGGIQSQLGRQMSQEAARTSTAAQSELASLVREGRLAGLGGLTGVETGIAGGRRDVAGLEVGAAGERGRLELGAAQAQTDMEQGIAYNKIQSAGGLQRLYESEPGYVSSLVQQILAVQTAGGQLSVEQQRILADLSKSPGVFDQIMKGVSAGTGVASAFMPTP